jgi:ADP-ribosylglycohydrolase
MGGATEMMHYRTIERVFGEISDLVPHGDTPETARFSQAQEAGRFTDDTRLRHILCDAIIARQGRVTADDLAATWRESLNGWFFVPVVNSYYKIMSDVRPRDAGRGNMASNSSAMSIAPVGIINACDPWQAAQDAYGLAGLIHEGYARDAAAMIAAAVAAAFEPGISVEQVIDAALAHVDRDSEMIDLVHRAVRVARESKDYAAFRAAFYEKMLVDWPQTDIVDGTMPPTGFYDTAEPRETIPAALALFLVAGGDPERAILHAANFGRDADTMGAIVGSLAGAYAGIERIPRHWVERVETVNGADMSAIARGLLAALVSATEGREQATGRVRMLLGDDD